MFNKLRSKWEVTPWQLVLVLCTFAIGGSLSGYLAKIVMGIFDMEKSFLWWIIYVIVVSCLWPLCVITISVFFGQYSFFSKYLRKLGSRIGLVKSNP